MDNLARFISDNDDSTFDAGTVCIFEQRFKR